MELDVTRMTKEEFDSLSKKERKKLEGTIPLTDEEISLAYEYASLACQNYKSVFQIYNIDKESVIQDTLLKAHRFKYGYRGDSEWSTYIYRIACNTLLNCISAAKRKGDVQATKKEYIEYWQDGEDVNASGFYQEISERSSTRELEDELIDEERMETFYEMVEELDEGMRDVILMLMQGQSYKQIAETMNLPLGSAQSRIYRAKMLLMEMAKTRLDK